MEPFGSKRGDMQAGIVAAALCSIHRNPSSMKATPKASDFILQFVAPEDGEEVVGQEMAAQAFLDAFKAMSTEHNERLAGGEQRQEAPVLIPRKGR